MFALFIIFFSLSSFLYATQAIVSSATITMNASIPIIDSIDHNLAMII